MRNDVTVRKHSPSNSTGGKLRGEIPTLKTPWAPPALNPHLHSHCALPTDDHTHIHSGLRVNDEIQLALVMLIKQCQNNLSRLL